MIITSHNQGITLIEVMVAISVFAIVVVIGIGTLLVTNTSFRRSQTERIVFDNLQLAMETMTREIRTGATYTCTGVSNCNTGPSNISFLSAQDPTAGGVTYTLDAGRVLRIEGDGSTQYLTSPDITIDTLRFHIAGEDPADNLQPRVLILLRGTSQVGRTPVSVNLQAFVSQRLLDI